MKEHKKIEPEAFVSFRIMDNVNLPENIDYNISVSQFGGTQDYLFTVNTKTKSVKLSGGGLAPEQHYQIKVC